MTIINYIVGDLIKAALNGEEYNIAHQCNCFCTMGAGIAPQIKNAFPKAYTVDCQTESGNPYKLGTFSCAVISNKYKTTVYNLYGQFHWRKYKKDGVNTDYDALLKAFCAMRDDLLEKGHTSIAMPRVGCGLAGGDWEVVEQLLEDCFENTDIEVNIYTL